MTIGDLKYTVCCLLIACFLPLSFCVHAQYRPSSNSNSPTANVQDTTEISSMIQRGIETIPANLDSGLLLLKQGLKESDRINFQPGQERALKTLINNLKAVNDSLVIVYCTRLLTMLQEKNDRSRALSTLTVMGNAFLRLARYAEALQSFNEGAKLAVELNDKKRQASMLMNIAIVHSLQGNYTASIEEYNESLAIVEQLGDEIAVAKCYFNMGSVYTEMKRFGKAIECYNVASKIYEARDHENLADVWNNLGAIHERQRNFELALEYYQKSLAAWQKIKLWSEVDLAHFNLGHVHYNLNQLTEAIYYFEKAYALADSSGDKRIMVFVLEGFAQLSLKKGRIDESKAYAKKGLALAKEISLLEKVKDISQLLYTLAKQEGDTREALALYELFRITEDSLGSVEKQKIIASVEQRFALEKKEREIEELRKSQRLIRIIIALAGAGVVLLVLLLFSYVRNYRRLRNESLLSKELMRNENLFLEERTTLAEAQLTAARATEEKLRSEVEFKSKELTTHALHLIEKNEALQEVKERLEGTLLLGPNEVKEKLKSIISSITLNFQHDKEWEMFRLHFERVHSHFFDSLRAQYPDITTTELKLCALIKLNLDTKKIATILGISPESVKTSRYRIRKKLNITSEASLDNFLSTVN